MVSDSNGGLPKVYLPSELTSQVLAFSFNLDMPQKQEEILPSEEGGDIAGADGGDQRSQCEENIKQKFPNASCSTVAGTAECRAR